MRLLLAALCIVALSSAQAEELEQLRTRIDKLESSLASDEVKFKNARGEVLDIERRLHAARTENERLQVQLDAKLEHITALREQRQLTLDDYADSTAALEALVIAHFKQTRHAKLKVLLKNNSIAEIQRNLKYYDLIAAANHEILQKQSHRLSALNDVESALKLEAGKLRQIRERTRSALADLNVSYETRTRVAKSLEEFLKHNKHALGELRNDENQLADLVDDVIEEILPAESPAAPQVSFSGLKGELEWPTVGPIAKAPGSAMRDGGAKWSGVIIESEPGSNVVAIADGRVAFADWFRNLGLLVIVDHGNGYMSLYGHNRELFKAGGDMVASGEILATVGDTGGRSTSGLYFEIRENGLAQDPRLWCKK